MDNPFGKKRERLIGLLSQRKQTTAPPPETAQAEDRGGELFSCKNCKAVFEKVVWAENIFVCPMCGYHHPLYAPERLALIMDEGIFEQLPQPQVCENPLMFPDYETKIADLREKTDLHDAVLCAVGKIGGVQTVTVVMDSRFLMGSMGSYLGEAVTQAVEYAEEHCLPLIIFSASGGARMQEGIFSLMQMAKTSAAIERFCSSGGLYIAFLTHPTTGGVSASFASLGDITLAEPGALIGFAGPRVIEQTIRQKLPEGFQRAEYLVEHGFVDMVVERSRVKETLEQLLLLHLGRGKTLA